MIVFVLSVAMLLCVGARAHLSLRGADDVVDSAFETSFVSFEKNANPDGELVLGLNRFASREEFVFNGSRCRSDGYTEVQQYENNERLQELPPESPAEELRIRSIRVYFHVITSSSGQGNVPDSVISSQMAVLNAAYNPVKFAFSLAGVTRSKNNDWYSGGINTAANTAMKRALRQGSYSDLNVYTTAQGDSTLGWATLPTQVGTEISFDGVVIDYRSMPGGAFFPYDQGMTLAHEAGHWLGLSHTFQGGCAVDPALGDEVPDTPAQNVANFGCPTRSNTCPGNIGALKGRDPINNYMNYVDDSCMDNFTPGQGKRMRSMFRLYRAGV